MAQFFRLAQHPLSFERMDAGDTRVKIGRTMSNYWGRDENYIIDAQTIDDSFQLQGALSRHFKLSLDVSSRKFTNAPMDNVAIAFHDIFFIPQDKRLKVPKNGTRVVAPELGLEITEKDLFKPISEQVGFKFEASQLYFNNYKFMAS